MNAKDFDRFVTYVHEHSIDLLHTKGREYAGTEDRLSNFKRGSALTGVTPLQVAHIYAAKHWDAVATYVRDQAKGEVAPVSEPIEGRIFDLINYMVLIAALLHEQGCTGRNE